MPDADRPNIVFLFSDQHRGDTLGCAGHVAETPNIDELADEGVRFEECYTTSPLCGPGRAALASGVYPLNNHCHDNGNDLPAEDREHTLYNALQDAGYYTALVGDADLGHADGVEHLAENEAYLREYGFDYVHETTGPPATRYYDCAMTDYWAEEGLLETHREDYERRWDESGFWPSPLPFEEQMDSYVGRQAIEFIDSYDRDQPFFLFVGFPGPHDPMDPPERFLDLYDPAEMPARRQFEPFGDWVPGAAIEVLERGGMAGDPKGWWRTDMDEAYAGTWRAHYYGKVTMVDHWVGEILDALGDDRDETFVAYTSDHGENGCDYDMTTKRTFFDGSVRVPLVVDAPDGARGATSDALVELIDLYPTLLDVAGAEPPYRSFGESLLPTAADPDRDTERDAAFSQVRGHNGQYKTMVVTEEYKYAVANEDVPYLLFDRREDPEETENLVGHPDYADAEREMRDHLLDFFQTAGTQYVNEAGEYQVRPPDRIEWTAR
jgi:arylsulfatase A-like enzyme